MREIARENYNNTPTGLSGVCVYLFILWKERLLKNFFFSSFLQNEDCGQMSAWYIFTAMGFYPVNPVSGEYVVGSYETIPLPPDTLL